MPDICVLHAVRFALVRADPAHAAYLRWKLFYPQGLQTGTPAYKLTDFIKVSLILTFSEKNYLFARKINYWLEFSKRIDIQNRYYRSILRIKQSIDTQTKLYYKYLY